MSLTKGMTITIPAGDRYDGTLKPTRFLLTEDPDMHRKQDWVHIKGVELNDDRGVTEVPVRLIVRAALLSEISSGERPPLVAEPPSLLPRRAAG